MINIRYTPQGQMGLRPSVRFIWTCVYFTESYYDNHTNTTEISPDYYIYSLEMSTLTMHDISSQYSSYVSLDQAPTLKSATKRRARQMAIPAPPAHPACIVMTTSSDTS